MVLPRGICTPNPVSAKLQPTPRMTSASCSQAVTGRGLARPPEPRERGWFSGNALLPSMLVVTGMFQLSASVFRASQALP